MSLRPAGVSRPKLAPADGPLLLIGLLAAAAAISGFTMLRLLDPYDEGQILLAARRVAQGDWPYADFVFPYGPGHPLLLGGLEQLLGQSLLWWRIIRVGADATVALLVYVLARRMAPRPVALVAWLIAATGMAQPGGPNPFPIALAFGLGALALATVDPPDAERGWRRPAAAGVLVALAAFWRIDFGAFAALGVLAALALAPAPRGDRIRAAAVFAGVSFGVGALLYAPFTIAAGPRTLYDQMVADALRDSSYWTLPFPLKYDGGLSFSSPRALAEDLKDVLGFYVPAALLAGLVAGAAACFVRSRRERLPWQWLGLLAFGLGTATYLRSRPDEFHAQPLLVALAVLLPSAAFWLARERKGVLTGTLLAATVAVVSMLALSGVANRLSALLLPPRLERVGLSVTSAVQAPPAEARTLREVVPYVKARVPPREPIFVAPRRSDLVRFDNLLFYILVDRDTVLDAGATLQALPAQQRRTIAALERARPSIVVRWTHPLSSQREPNRRGRPSGSRILDAYLARTYRPEARFGYYRVLRRR